MKFIIILFIIINTIIIHKVNTFPGTCANRDMCIEFCQYCKQQGKCCPVDCDSRWAEGCDNRCIECSNNNINLSNNNPNPNMSNYYDNVLPYRKLHNLGKLSKLNMKNNNNKFSIK